MLLGVYCFGYFVSFSVIRFFQVFDILGWTSIAWILGVYCLDVGCLVSVDKNLFRVLSFHLSDHYWIFLALTALGTGFFPVGVRAG